MLPITNTEPTDLKLQTRDEFVVMWSVAHVKNHNDEHNGGLLLHVNINST